MMTRGVSLIQLRDTFFIRSVMSRENAPVSVCEWGGRHWQIIEALVISIWPLDDLVCAIAAPTGLAAFNVGGTTIHRLFQLPIEHSAKTASYWSLPKSSQKVMKTTL